VLKIYLFLQCALTGNGAYPAPNSGFISASFSGKKRSEP